MRSDGGKTDVAGRTYCIDSATFPRLYDGFESSLPVAENKVDRKLERVRPNEVWVSDVTYIPKKSGWLYHLHQPLVLDSLKVQAWHVVR